MISKQGWINLYKPKNITSFKAINSIKKKFLQFLTYYGICLYQELKLLMIQKLMIYK